MEFLSEDLQLYVERHSSEESDLLKRINRETHLDVLMPRMLSGHLQGRVLSMISKMVRPSNILEIGTYTGYSAICLAEGIQPQGKLTTIDINEELHEKVVEYFREAGLLQVIDYRIGDALKIIPTLQSSFELVFIDADKENYSKYFDLVIERVAKGGFILADNVLWSGRVLDSKPDKDTKAIKAFNQKVSSDPRVESVLLSIRDGIMVLRKK